MKTTLVSWLLRLYPKAWRTEYGAELSSMLLARPLSAAIVIDVAASACGSDCDRWRHQRTPVLA